MTATRTVGLLAALLFLPLSGWSQGDLERPAEKTSEAVNKSKSAPGNAARDLRALKETAETRLKGLGNRASVPKEDDDPLALPELGPHEPRFSPAGLDVQRDPFRPFGLEVRPQNQEEENLAPLQRFEIGQLKLVGIVWNIPVPRAMVEDTAGLGYVVKVGTPIGRNNGKVKSIGPKEVVIQESVYDFYGARRTREVKLKLASE